MSLAERQEAGFAGSSATPSAGTFAGGRFAGTVSRRTVAVARLGLDAGIALLLLAAAGLLATPAKAVVVVSALTVTSLLLRRSRTSRLSVRTGILSELPRLMQVSIAAALVVVTTDGLLAVATNAGTTIARTWSLLLLAVTAGHILGSALQRRLAAPQRCLLIGGHRHANEFARSVALAGKSSIELVARIPLDSLGARAAGREPIEDAMAAHGATRVIVLEGGDRDRSAQAARRARNAGASVSYVPETFASIGMPEHAEQVGHAVLLSVSPGCSEITRPMAGKRAFDVVGASLLLVLMAPVLALIAAAIKLTSPGPVLFWQCRIGLDGRRFHIAKFRSMVIDAEARKAELRAHNEAGGGLFKIERDPRVTRIGNVLRRTSLDELPQLLNVLRGQMSLVGPRPLICEEDELIEGWHRDRLRLKPGMTGVWQVMGSARIPLHEMVNLDQQYVANWSLWLDLQVLARTALFVVRRRGL